MKTIVLTSLALIAFASNSILNRLALAEDQIDPYSFAVVRFFSGALIFAIILICFFRSELLRFRRERKLPGSWVASVSLFVYGIAFSVAYVSLDAGVGALILFGTVQITMVLIGLLGGRVPRVYEWSGLGLAFAGFVYLVAPTLELPSFLGFIFMTIAGIAWGFYSHSGRDSVRPLLDTAFNFLRTIPLLLVVALLTLGSGEMTSRGIALACLSGVAASGLGYTIWYMALPGLASVQAAMVQLLVPVIAALGGVWLLNEFLDIRTLVSGFMILFAILIVISGNYLLEKRRVSG